MAPNSESHNLKSTDKTTLFQIMTFTTFCMSKNRVHQLLQLIFQHLSSTFFDNL